MDVEQTQHVGIKIKQAQNYEDEIEDQIEDEYQSVLDDMVVEETSLQDLSPLVLETGVEPENIVVLVPSDHHDALFLPSLSSSGPTTTTYRAGTGNPVPHIEVFDSPIQKSTEDVEEEKCFNLVYNKDVDFGPENLVMEHKGVAENYRAEYYSSLRNIIKNQLVKVVSGMSNLDKKAILMLGIDAEGMVVGFKLTEEEKRKAKHLIENKIKKITPNFTSYEIRFKEIEKKKDNDYYIVEVVVDAKGPVHLHTSEGKCWIRQHARTVEMKPEYANILMIKRMKNELYQGIESWYERVEQEWAEVQQYLTTEEQEEISKKMEEIRGEYHERERFESLRPLQELVEKLQAMLEYLFRLYR